MLQCLINNGCTLLSFAVKRGTSDLSVFFWRMYMGILSQQSSRAPFLRLKGFEKVYVSTMNPFYERANNDIQCLLCFQFFSKNLDKVL